MDEFAQTRGADDLFDDDFTPVAEPIAQTFNSQPRSFQRGAHNGPPSRRGNRAQDSFQRQNRQQAASQAVDTPNADTIDQTLDQEASPPVEPDSSTNPQPETSQAQFKHQTAVRGDRTATGGTPKPKLTEEELSARLAAAKLNSAKRAEAHRLAEADEASFQQREAHASQKRKEEGQAKRVMNMEREKNRMRKLGAQAGREWDEGKEELDTRDERSSQYRRGAHGGVMYEGGRGRRGGGYGDGRNTYQNGDYSDLNQESHERRGGFRGRGRGDRGRGRGRGRGGFNHNNDAPQQPPDPVSDFPALPSTSNNTKVTNTKSLEDPLSPTVGESWADEVQAAKAPDK